MVWPTLISAETHTLSCRVEVRARRAVDSLALPDVIRAATPEAERRDPLLTAITLPVRTAASAD